MNQNNNNYTKLILYFIFILGVIAVSLWSVFLIQLSYVIDQLNRTQLEHDKLGHMSQENTELNLNLTKINMKNIENILNNITEIKQELNSTN